MTTNESGERSRTTANFTQLLDLRHQEMTRTSENYKFAVGLVVRAAHERPLCDDARLNRLWDEVLRCRAVHRRAVEAYKEMLPVPEKKGE